MRIHRKVALAAVTMSLITSCKSGQQTTSKMSTTPVPAPVENEVTISSKKGKLTKYQEKNWQHLDLAKDTIPGMSVSKAHDFLKGKKSNTVIVCVLDSGTDLKHEDLKDVAWVNEKEIAGNNKDDDNNGFVDDINGWNFLGDLYKEHMEWERILMYPKIANAKLLKDVKKFQEEKIEKSKEDLGYYSKMMGMIDKSHKAYTKKFGKSGYTIKDVKEIKTKTPEQETSKKFVLYILVHFENLPEAKKYFEDKVKESGEIIASKNLEKDYRKIIGDNAYDLEDKKGYGNSNTGHSKKSEAHGSHVAGIIGATRLNGTGMDGVANNVEIMAVRVVPDGDEYDKDIALGIRYAVDNGAKVINTSFGKSYSPKAQWVWDAIKYAAKKDVLIVNAAGNSSQNIDIDKTFPNDAPDQKTEISDNFLTVGASTYSYNKKLPATFTNYGKKNVDVFGPGYQIYSTTPENEYKKFNGTSMASPNVAGVAALIRSYYPSLTASQVKHIIMNSGTKVSMDVLLPGSEDKLVPFSDLSVSGRLANAYNAVKMAEEMVNKK